jgi:hypothetical protein
MKLRCPHIPCRWKSDPPRQIRGRIVPYNELAATYNFSECQQPERCDRSNVCAGCDFRIQIEYDPLGMRASPQSVSTSALQIYKSGRKMGELRGAVRRTGVSRR